MSKVTLVNQYLYSSRCLRLRLSINICMVVSVSGYVCQSIFVWQSVSKVTFVNQYLYGSRCLRLRLSINICMIVSVSGYACQSIFVW